MATASLTQRSGVLRRIARWLARRQYPHLEITGADRIPQTGPVLICANHPNSLLDPVLLGIAAGRPVQFLAKAPLFDLPLLGMIFFSIPVQRFQPDAVGKDPAGIDGLRHRQFKTVIVFGAGGWRTVPLTSGQDPVGIVGVDLACSEGFVERAGRGAAPSRRRPRRPCPGSRQARSG